MKHSTTDAMKATTPVTQVSAALAPPGRHPELAPQVDDHEGHEQLDAPQVQAVEEVPDRVGVPPVDASEGDGDARDDHHRQGRPGWRRRTRRSTRPRRRAGGRGAACPAAACGAPGVRSRAVHMRAVLGSLGRTGGAGPPASGPGASSGRLVAAGEGQEQGDAEDHDHDGDEHEVGHRDREDRPVEVPSRSVEVHRGSGQQTVVWHSAPPGLVRSTLCLDGTAW